MMEHKISAELLKVLDIAGIGILEEEKTLFICSRVNRDWWMHISKEFATDATLIKAIAAAAEKYGRW